MKRNEKTTWENILIAGVFCVLVGLLLLFFTTGVLKPFGTIVPSLFILSGASGIVLILKRAYPSKYLFLATTAVLTGIFLLLHNLGVFGASFSKLWPALPLIIGLSLLPPGFRQYHRLKARFIIPAMLFIILSGVFFLFSLRIITISLRLFIAYYWPLIFVALGSGLLVLYLLNRFDVIKRSPRE